MMKSELVPSFALAGLFAVLMAFTPTLGLDGPPDSYRFAAEVSDPLSPELVNPYIEQEARDTAQPKSMKDTGERAYATLEVEPLTAAGPFPVVRTNFREPADPSDPTPTNATDRGPRVRSGDDPGG